MIFTDTYAPAKPSAPRPILRTLPVAIFYEDIAAADRALHSVRHALRFQRDSRLLQPMLWNVHLLEEDQWRRLAAADVAAADLCIVSLSRETRTAGSAAWFGELSAGDTHKWVTLAPFEPAPTLLPALSRAG